MMNTTKEELDKVRVILNSILDWYGITDETPDDTEIFIMSDGSSVTLDDIKLAIGTIDTLKYAFSSKPGVISDVNNV